MPFSDGKVETLISRDIEAQQTQCCIISTTSLSSLCQLDWATNKGLMDGVYFQSCNWPFSKHGSPTPGAPSNRPFQPLKFDSQRSVCQCRPKSWRPSGWLVASPYAPHYSLAIGFPSLNSRHYFAASDVLRGKE